MKGLTGLVAGMAIAMAGCGGGEVKPPAGSEGSATSLDIQVEPSDGAETPEVDQTPAKDK